MCGEQELRCVMDDCKLNTFISRYILLVLASLDFCWCNVVLNGYCESLGSCTIIQFLLLLFVIYPVIRITVYFLSHTHSFRHPTDYKI